MHSTLLLVHSWSRWLVLGFLLYAIYRASIGYFKNVLFTKADDSVRHWTATVAHIQLMLGIILFTNSPVAKGYWVSGRALLQDFDTTFFGLIHSIMMLTSVVILTIGSALAKRTTADRDKFRIMFLWFSVALLIIFIAIPWPFSPFSNRPYLRTF
ncbi:MULTISPECIES: hypothetical protein [unclassified Sphingobacterium]|uniref:hypothetical protein n=1 Tax=unclassified Sphingobacterium TaxID=2609468 RepID=UPI0025E71E1E|nr:MULTISPECIES: hypothetical protein [unclassified Sphingobacterium]